MTLRVPITKATNAGLRKLSSRDEMKTALKTLKGRSRVRRTMWSRRAQEYEAKINSGDPVSIAEVVRDLHRRSEEHTSELQSLMRISYAVFCLKTKHITCASTLTY